MNPVRIALLGTGTMTGWPEVLSVAASRIGIPVAVSLGAYNQYAQEILDSESAVFSNDPELVILAVHLRSLLGDQFFHPYAQAEAERRAWAANTLAHLGALIERICARSSARVILHNFEVPLHSPLGILEGKQPFGFHESVQWLNAALQERYRSDPRVFVFDYNRFAGWLGKQHSINDKLYYLGDITVNPEWMERLAASWISYIRPLRLPAKKCIVLDCDNTLWGGVLGEEGIHGIHLGPTPQGRPFLELQKYLLSLYHTGVLLALNSRNTAEDVAHVLEHHPHTVLRQQHFAGMRVNWQDKVSNMRELSEELNLGLDSFVFLDDDALQRDMVREMLPEVRVVELPNDPALYVRTLMEFDEFSSFEFTKEDEQRGAMYAQDRQRRAVAATTGSIEDYLRTIEIQASIARATPMTIPRIAQLTQKTNQFNTTTRRYSEAEIQSFAARPEMLVLSLAAKDKFGDNGITGVAIVDARDSAAWRIVTFLLSCRVLGRRLEQTLLADVMERARANGARTLLGEFIPTEKNAPAKEFYEQNGFSFSGKEGSIERWTYKLEHSYPFPEGVKVIEK